MLPAVRGALAKDYASLTFDDPKPTTVSGMTGVSTSGTATKATESYELLLLALDTPAAKDLLVVVIDTAKNTNRDLAAFKYILSHISPHSPRPRSASVEHAKSEGVQLATIEFEGAVIGLTKQDGTTWDFSALMSVPDEDRQRFRDAALKAAAGFPHRSADRSCRKFSLQLVRS